MAGKLVHFEVPADDTRRAIDFYSQMFGWSFQAMDGPVQAERPVCAVAR